jgi:hypothetical protein
MMSESSETLPIYAWCKYANTLFLSFTGVQHSFPDTRFFIRNRITQLFPKKHPASAECYQGPRYINHCTLVARQRALNSKAKCNLHDRYVISNTVTAYRPLSLECSYIIKVIARLGH